jgi:hypothetical protein
MAGIELTKSIEHEVASTLAAAADSVSTTPNPAGLPNQILRAFFVLGLPKSLVLLARCTTASRIRVRHSVDPDGNLGSQWRFIWS